MRPVNLVAVVLLVWTHAVAEAIARPIPVQALIPPGLTAHLTQQRFLRLAANAMIGTPAVIIVSLA